MYVVYFCIVAKKIFSLPKVELNEFYLFLKLTIGFTRFSLFKIWFSYLCCMVTANKSKQKEGQIGLFRCVISALWLLTNLASKIEACRSSLTAVSVWSLTKKWISIWKLAEYGTKLCSLRVLPNCLQSLPPPPLRTPSPTSPTLYQENREIETCESIILSERWIMFHACF